MILLQLLCSLLFAPNQGDIVLTVIVEDLPTATGHVYIGLYDGPELWLEDAPFGGKYPVQKDRTARVEIPDLAPGTYAISFYHDVNDSGEMDYNLVGYPKEPFGFSAGAKAVFKAPAFTDATFELTSDMQIKIKPQ